MRNILKKLNKYSIRGWLGDDIMFYGVTFSKHKGFNYPYIECKFNFDILGEDDSDVESILDTVVYHLNSVGFCCKKYVPAGSSPGFYGNSKQKWYIINVDCKELGRFYSNTELLTLLLDSINMVVRPLYKSNQ